MVPSGDHLLTILCLLATTPVRATLLNNYLKTMILDNTSNSLHQEFACGHKDWSSRFMAIPQTDQTKENEQMAEIINLVPTNDPCDKSKMTALINNKRPPFSSALTPQAKASSCFITSKSYPRHVSRRNRTSVPSTDSATPPQQSH
jgi:hypothetical protein